MWQQEFFVLKEFRGIGLAQIGNDVAIEYAKLMGCRYVFAYMVTPQTIHISKKAGYEILNTIGLKDLFFFCQESTHSDEEKSKLDKRLALLREKFGGADPINVVVRKDISSL